MTTRKEISKALNEIKDNAIKQYDAKKRPHKIESVGSFFKGGAASLAFIFSEKENILFAILQLVSIALGYFIWIQVLDWIPQSVWDSLKDSDGDSPIINLVVFLWSFICVGLTAYPLGLLTACMGASYMLRFEGKKSTIADCLKIVFNKSWVLWVFSWIDGWWTTLRILERLPKKRDHTPLSVKLRNEAIYQAWKAASLGFMPATLCGRSLKDSCKDSLLMLKDRFVPLLKLRLGYSFICWVLGIGCYVSIFFLMPFVSKFSAGHNEIYGFYFFVGFPALVALTFIMIIFRPIYIVSACRIYAFYAREKEIPIQLPQQTSGIISSLIAFIVLAIILSTVVLYRDQLGLTELLSIPH